MSEKRNKINNTNWIIILREKLTNKTLISYGLPLSLFILLHQSIEDVFNVLLVNPLFSKIDSTNLNNIIFWIIASYALLLFSSRIISFVASANAFFFQIVVCLIYIYYRNHQEIWIFHPLKGYKYFFYTDLIFEITALNGLLLLKQLLVKKQMTLSKGFEDDSPIGKSKPDQLGYEPYAKSVAERIKQTHPDTAIAIGINGRWGSGKTSFFDLLKRNMTDEQIIVINFDPWNALSPRAIIKDFFDTVQRATQPYHSQLPKLLDKYTNKLISLHSEGWGKFAKELKSVMVPEQSLNDLFEQINKKIIAIGRKIIIYIDDLDRLDKEEIAEVIRLIRNTANFSNTFFIVAYDRNYVLNAIKAMNTFNHSHFLEKIFQIEFNLPYFNPSIIQRKLADLLKDYYVEDYHEMIEKEIVGTDSSFPNYFEGWIETLRDVTRLSNGITLNLDQLLSEVVFSEFVRLEIFRLRYPSIYEAFYRNSSSFLQISDKHNSIDGYTLKLIGDTRGDDFKLTKEHSEFEFFIHQNAERLCIELQEIKNIVELIDSLFGVSKYTARFRSHLSVIYPSRFELYFSYSLLEGKLSEDEFLQACNGGITKLKTQIDKWARENLNFEVLRRFLQVKDFKNRNEFETVIEGIFYFGRQPDNKSQYGYENLQLANLLSDEKNNISKKFYDDKQDMYSDFMRRLFADAKTPYSFDSHILEHLNKSFEDSFPISKSERLIMVQNLLRSYTVKVEAWDDNIWDLYHACSYKEWTPTSGTTYRSDTIYPDEAKQIMITAIEQNIETFLPTIIEFPPFIDGQMFINNIVTKIFGSYEAFGDFLDKLDNPSKDIFEEFGKFYRKLAIKEFKTAVPFDFKAIKVINRSYIS